MIAMGEDSIKTSGYRIARSDFSKSERSKKTNNRSAYPRYKKYLGYYGFVGNFNRSAKDSHSNYQAHHYHGEIKQAEFGFNRHGCAGFRCLVAILQKIERVLYQNKLRWVWEHLILIEKFPEDFLR